MTARVGTVLLWGLLALAAAAAAIAVNLVLLDRASTQSEPVGKLRPRAHLPAAPAGTVRPTHGPLHGEENDD